MKILIVIIIIFFNFLFCNNKKKEEAKIYKNHALCLVLASESNSKTRGTGNIILTSIEYQYCMSIFFEKINKLNDKDFIF